MSDGGELRAALKRCHALLQDAEAWIDPDLHPAWSVAVTEELKPCDEAMECPTVLAPKPAPRGERRVRQEQPERYLAIDGEDRRTPALAMMKREK